MGDGPQAKALREQMKDNPRVHFLGALSGQELIDAYHLMDVFVFASKSETQGMVLAEAMAAGVPVAALDAPGVRDVVVPGENGRLLTGNAPPSALASAAWWVIKKGRRLTPKKTAEQFSLRACAEKAVSVYQHAGYTDKRMLLLKRVFS